MTRPIDAPSFDDEPPVNLWGGYALPAEPPELPPEDDPDAEYVPTSRHICGVGGAPKPEHPRYRRCRCGQWYHYGGTLWRPVTSPPREWLRTHGLGGNAEDLWNPGTDDERESASGEFFTSLQPWYALRILVRRWCRNTGSRTR